MKVRLHVDQPLSQGQAVPLTPDQANYLFNVMRLVVGDPVQVFNGKDGEWRADVMQTGKRGALGCVAQTAPLRLPPDVWLLFAPIKKTRTDFIVEKATEMGVTRILPVQTRFTNADRIRQDRCRPMRLRRPSNAAVPSCRRLMSCSTSTACLQVGPPTGGSCGAMNIWPARPLALHPIRAVPGRC
jgi:RsmE family RNA methyltransferase